MADIALKPTARTAPREATAWDRLKTNNNWLSIWFMLPAAAFLVLFLAYPLGLGVWLSFTDAKIGRGGEFIGIENYEWLWDDSIFWLSVFNTSALHDRRQRASNSRSASISRCCSTKICRSRLIRVRLY